MRVLEAVGAEVRVPALCLVELAEAPAMWRPNRYPALLFHLAAAVGVGQSMYQISEYTATNNLGTANLFQAILDTRSQPDKIVVASSMS